MTIFHEYETIYILKPELPEDSSRAVAEKLSGIIENFEGRVLSIDDWGKRRMAYNIKKNSKGHYVRFHYVAPSPLIAELERNLRIDDRQMRFLTVRLGIDVDVDSRVAEAEVAAAAAAAATAEAEGEGDAKSNATD